MLRREFVRLIGLQALAWSLGCGRRSTDLPPALPANPFTRKWMGDDFTSPHRLRDGKLPSLLTGTEMPAVDAVVVGGGISGLSAAYRLAKPGRRVVVLEQAPAAGGNAKSASWGEIEYSIGSAYFADPEKGSELEGLYRQIGVLDRSLPVTKGEVFQGGELIPGFWDGAAIPAERDATVRVARMWRAMYDTRYPQIPWAAGGGWSEEDFENEDWTPFSQYLDRIDAPPAVRRYAKHYCWSSFGGSPEEVSSYAALNFLTAEFGAIRALPGGNAGVAGALTEALQTRGVGLETGHLVARVRDRGDLVEAVAVRGDRVARFPAKVCVFAAPRFMAHHVLEGFPENRQAIVAGMKWRAYLVANVLLSKRPSAVWYDAYRLDELDPTTCGWTDLILADFVATKRPDRFAVLTAYRALPFEGGRRLLETIEQYDEHRAAVIRDLGPHLAALGLGENDILDVNLARWGHPMVLAQPGQLASGDLERLSAPLGRVVFAHQDRFGTPAIETAIEAGFAAAREAERLLAG